MEHSKLPWVNGWNGGLTGGTTVLNGYIAADDRLTSKPISCGTDTIAMVLEQDRRNGGKETMEANAAFIVRAVNNHDALVALLKRSLKAYDIPNDSYLVDKAFEKQATELLKQIEA